MIFNLIPIPPHDGSRILGLFLSHRAYFSLMQYERYSIILIMLLSVSGMFDRIIGGGVGFIFTALINLMNAIVGMVL